MNRSLPHCDNRRLLLAAAALGTTLLTLPSGTAGAEEKPARRVLLLTDKPADHFVERIKAEIVALGLSIVTQAPSGPLEEVARGQHVVAAIRVLPAGNGVEMWMADETSGRSLLRQVVIDERPEGPDQNLVALQTAELLRTSLLTQAPEIGAQNPSAGPAPPTEIASASVARQGASSAPAEAAPDANMGVQAGMGAQLSPGGTSPEVQLWLSLHRFFGRHLGLALDLSLPVVRATLDGPEGTAKIGTMMAGLAVLARVHSAPSAWFLTAGLGAGVLRVAAEGVAGPTLISFSSSMITGAGYARLEAGYALAAWLRLGGHVLGGVALDHVHLRFAENDAGSWGRPFAVAALFAEAGW